MDNRIKKYLFDMLTSLNSIESYIGEVKDFNIYQKNKMLRRAVEREFEIIGEAMNKINKFDNSVPISSKERIISMRNFIIHGYDKVDDVVVWGTVIKHLPILKDEITELLND